MQGRARAGLDLGRRSTPAPVSTANVWGAVPSFVTSKASASPTGAWIIGGLIANSVRDTCTVVAAADAAPSSGASSPAAVQPLAASITIKGAASAA